MDAQNVAVASGLTARDEHLEPQVLHVMRLVVGGGGHLRGRRERREE